MDYYSSYKDSGVEWIQKIPLSWNKSRIRMVGKLYGGLTGKKGNDFNNDDSPFNKPFVPFTNIFNNTYISKNHFQYVKIGEGENQNRVLKYDLFFLMSSESYEDLGKCSILLEDIEELYLNSFCKGYRIKDKRVNPLFLNYQLLGSLHKEMISIEGNGFTRINLRQDRLLDIPVFIPPLNEQTQIVSFLDTKTQKIDELIKNTEQKIKLLKEKRTSLINHCVTKGLNPDVEMKDSGVEWIREIPKDWLVSKIMFITNKVTDGSHHSPETEDEGKLYVTVSNVTKGNDIDFNSCSKISEDSFSDLEKNGCKPEKGDVLITKDGTIGRGLVVSGFNDYVILSSIGLIRFQEKINPYYGLYYLLSGLNIDQMYSHVRGSGITRLTINLIKNLLFILPSETEQNQIVEYLDEQTQKIDFTIKKETQRIELLKEYRQSLISEVVTGKVDVRDWNG